MKKKYNLTKTILGSILISSISSSLFAQTIVKDENYTNALLNYKQKSYEKSYEGFKKHLDKYGLDKDVAFMLGRSASELGNYEDALIAYEKVLLSDPNSLRTKLEIAQVYFQMKEYNKSEEYFNEVLKENIPEQVRKNIQLSLASLKTKNKKNFLRTTFIFGLGYDSNVGNYSDDNLKTYDINKESDDTNEIILSLNHNYKINDIYALENKFIGFTKRYTSNSEKNFDMIALGTALSYYQKDYKLSLGFDYSHIWLNGNHYMNNYSLKPSFKKKIVENLDYSGYVKIIKKDFKQTEYQYKDSILYEVDNSLDFTTKDYGLNTLSFKIGTENKDEGTHYNVDNNFFSLKGTNKYPLSKTIILTNAIEVYKEKFSKVDEINVTPKYNTKRTNTKISLSSNIIKSIDKNLAIGATASYVKNESNQKEDYTYDKYSLKTNLYYSF